VLEHAMGGGSEQSRAFKVTSFASSSLKATLKATRKATRKTTGEATRDGSRRETNQGTQGTHVAQGTHGTRSTQSMQDNREGEYDERERGAGGARGGKRALVRDAANEKVVPLRVPTTRGVSPPRVTAPVVVREGGRHLSCIDGRGDYPVLGAAGGDFGEFALGLGAVETL
jgi:hypothetical protein